MIGFLKRSGGASLAFLVALGGASVAAGYTASQHLRQHGGSVAAALIPAPQTVFGHDDLRVLVVGLDYDYDDRDMETSAHSRSDIIMAVRLDFATHKIYELSVPRDMVATMPDGSQAKINQAQSDGGITESENVVSHWLGSPPFDRYVVLRIDTMKDLINALGGVDVDVMNSDALRHAGPNGPVDYDDSWGHLHVHLKPGEQHLTGDQAVGYARFRHDWCSDPCRIMRQQQVIKAILARLHPTGPDALLHVAALVNVARKDVQTNLKPSEELSLAAAFAHDTPKDVVAAQVPYTQDVDLPGYGDSIIADESAKRRLVATMLADPPQRAVASDQRLDPDGDDSR